MALGVAVTMGAVMLSGRAEPEADEPAVMTLPVPTDIVSVRPEPSPPPPPKPPGITPCCTRRGDCLSRGMACQPAPCEDAALPDRLWLLRLIGVARRPDRESGFSEDMSRTYPAAVACMSRKSTGEEICVPFTRNPGASAEPDRLPITTAELVRGDVVVRVTEADKPLSQGAVAANHDWLRSGVLCQGLLLYVGEKASASVRVSVALDTE
ncbi:hypothetical protein BE08_41305 [Sorangium cellulosum]|uniref:Uncharacterized protein n=1 Tax=Sorangium cellulosum TaxID=56 RepID=A0A150P196_SORCE|nr:hypothetical protein BE08_41305 [Sorangium cellulosum]